jgi:two-component system, chemotaxis family, protein-glutamate methylesterase/glutaminase
MAERRLHPRVMNGQRVIVVGASAGGVQAMMQLASALPADLAAPMLVVVHVGAHPSVLPILMSKNSALPVTVAQQGEKICAGHVYVAPPDHHMLLEEDHILLTRGPKEHHTRPAIDPLFRSAALSFGPRAVGVVLTGMLDDGTPGLQAIKRAGGTTVVQDPDDAVERSMPESALQYVDVDHCLPLALMPVLLETLANEPAMPADGPSGETDMSQERHEHELSLHRGDPVGHLQAIGAPSAFTCPDCHGGLWEVLDSRPTRYRCHTGHAFTLQSLENAMSEEADASLQNALRALQEKQMILAQMATFERAEGRATASQTDDAAANMKRQAELLCALIENGK